MSDGPTRFSDVSQRRASAASIRVRRPALHARNRPAAISWYTKVRPTEHSRQKSAIDRAIFCGSAPLGGAPPGTSGNVDTTQTFPVCAASLSVVCPYVSAHTDKPTARVGVVGVSPLDQHSRNLMRFCGSPQLEA